MSTCADRQPRPAWTLREGDVIHDTLASMRVTGWRGLQLCGLTRSRVPIRVAHPLGRVLDVTRLIDHDDPDERDAMNNLAFIAMTTTGPSADAHEIWELSVRLRPSSLEARDAVHHWQLPVRELHRGDRDTLHESQFYSRHLGGADPIVMVDPVLQNYRATTLADMARTLAVFLVDAHPVLLWPEAHQPFLAALLRRTGFPAVWRRAVPLAGFAAGAAYGYANGWNRHVELVQPDLLSGQDDPASAAEVALARHIDTSGYAMPWHPVDMAKDMGLPPALWADTVSAAGRLALTVALWESIVTPTAAVRTTAAAESTLMMPITV